MALPVQSIGSFDFNILRGPIGAWGNDVEQIDRAGVDEFALRNLGQRGKQFVLESVRDVLTVAAGFDLLLSYQSLIGASPVVLIKDSYNFTASNGLDVAVLAVGLISVVGIDNVVNPIETDPQAVLRARWSLRFVPD